MPTLGSILWIKSSEKKMRSQDIFCRISERIIFELLQSLIFKRKIKGEKDGGYFGHAIANAGDMDGDQKDG